MYTVCNIEPASETRRGKEGRKRSQQSLFKFFPFLCLFFAECVLFFFSLCSFSLPLPSVSLSLKKQMWGDRKTASEPSPLPLEARQQAAGPVGWGDGKAQARLAAAVGENLG